LLSRASPCSAGTWAQGSKNASFTFRRCEESRVSCSPPRRNVWRDEQESNTPSRGGDAPSTATTQGRGGRKKSERGGGRRTQEAPLEVPKLRNPRPARKACSGTQRCLKARQEFGLLSILVRVSHSLWPFQAPPSPPPYCGPVIGLILTLSPGILLLAYGVWSQSVGCLML